MTTTSRLLHADGTHVSLAEIEAVRQTSDDRIPQTQRVAYKMRQAGVLMTADQAMTISAVWACVRFLCQGVAKLPWRVKKQTGTNSQLQEKHPVDWMINKRPAPEWSSFQFRETLIYWALRHGNGYAEIERSLDGRPINLHPLAPYRVVVMRDVDTQELFYRVNGGSGGQGSQDLDAKDVFHLRGLGEGTVGLNVMAYAAASLGWAKAAQVFGSSFFSHGGQLAGVVTMKKALTPEALKVLRGDFTALYGGGPSKANGVAFLDNEMDYKSIAVEPDKGQFIETNKFLLDEVCRWFGVPPHKIYNLDKATFSNIEHQSIEVVEDSLKPWIQRLQDEADYKLFGEQNRNNLYTQIEVKKMLRADTTTRMQYYQGLRNIGALNADEIRDEEEINAIGEKAGGNKYTLQSGMTTLERIGEEPVVAPGGTAKPPAEVSPSKPGPEPAPDKGTPEKAEPATTAIFWQLMIANGTTEEALALEPTEIEVDA